MTSVASATPSQSIRRPDGRLVCGSRRGPAASSARPTGTLMRNTGRHEAPKRSRSTSNPPSTWPHDDAGAHHRGEQGHGLHPRRAVVLELDHRHHLRAHRRGGDALADAGGDEDLGRPRQPGEQRRQREAGQAGQEQAAVAVVVAQPRAGDQQRGVGERVARDHQLQRGAADAHVGLQRGTGDVDDRRVEAGHERPREEDGQRLGRGRRGHVRQRRAARAAPRFPAR